MYDGFGDQKVNTNSSPNPISSQKMRQCPFFFVGQGQNCLEIAWDRSLDWNGS